MLTGRFISMARRALVGSIISAGFVVSPVAVAQDLERERRMAAEIVDAILDGEAVYLGPEGAKFLTIYTESEEEPALGTVILTHGRGFHPDWAEVVGPLRVGLAEAGWHTLSIQMPVLEKGAKYYDYVPIFPAAYPRIDAAIAFAREQFDGPVVMLAHSCSVHMTMAYAKARGFEGIDGYVGVGMGATDYKQPMASPLPLDQLTMPVLDIYGAEDFPAVGRLAPRRAENLRKGGHAGSRQLVIEGADHYFRDQEEALLEAVSSWLSENFAP